MDSYWLNSKDPAVAGKKLDDDMDSYWAKKGEKGDEGEGEGEGEGDVVEEEAK